LEAARAALAAAQASNFSENQPLQTQKAGLQFPMLHGDGDPLPSFLLRLVDCLS
jgi:hypothetical protein